MEPDEVTQFVIDLPNTDLELFEARLGEYWTYMFLDMGMERTGQKTFGVYKWGDEAVPDNLQGIVIASHYQRNQLKLIVTLSNPNSKFGTWLNDWLYSGYGVGFLPQETQTVQPSTSIEPEQEKTPNIELLTNREREVACLLAKGKRRNEIATELLINPETVKSHWQNISHKWGLNGKIATKRLQEEAKKRGCDNASGG